MNVMTDGMLSGTDKAEPAQAKTSVQAPDGPGSGLDDNKAVALDALKALEAAREALASEAEAARPSGAPEHVDVGAGVSADHQLDMAREASDRESERMSTLPAPDPGFVSEITEDDKDAFIASVTTGCRYRRTASIFGGRVKIGLRARTAGESEAIDSYIRRRVNDGTIKVGAEYSDQMRLCLLVFDVERLGEESFPDISGSLLAVSTPSGVVEPEWTRMIDVWRSKPEGLVNAVLPEVFKFETKYAEMVRRGADENFWSTGGSTGE